MPPRFGNRNPPKPRYSRESGETIGESAQWFTERGTVAELSCIDEDQVVAEIKSGVIPSEERLHGEHWVRMVSVKEVGRRLAKVRIPLARPPGNAA